MASTESISQPKTALVLVDVTNSFFLAGMPNFYPASAEALEPLRALLGEPKSGKHDDDNDVRQGLDEFGRHAVTLESDLGSVERPEQQSAKRGAKRRCPSEIESCKRDEAATSSNAFVE